MKVQTGYRLLRKVDMSSVLNAGSCTRVHSNDMRLWVMHKSSFTSNVVYM